MIEIFHIEDLRIAQFVSLRKQSSKLCVAEGEKCVQALLDSDLTIKALFASAKYAQKYQQEGIPFYTASDEIMSQIVGYKMHQGIMASAVIPQPLDLQEICGPAIALNGLANAENVGAIMRNCVAFGIQNLIVDKKCSPPYMRRSIKTSMGAVFKLNIFYCEELQESLSKISHELVLAHPRDEAIDLKDFTFPKEYILVIGSEGHGIDEKILSSVSTWVKISINPEVESLNAAATSAILLYHAS